MGSSAALAASANPYGVNVCAVYVIMMSAASSIGNVVLTSVSTPFGLAELGERPEQRERHHPEPADRDQEAAGRRQQDQ